MAQSSAMQINNKGIEMDKTSAAFLLASLIERVERDQIGSVSMHEREALKLALRLLKDDHEPSNLQQSLITPTSHQQELASEAAPVFPKRKKIVLNRSRLQDLAGTPIPVESAAITVNDTPEQSPQTEPVTAASTELPQVKLVVDAILKQEFSDPDALLCLDFGTAMSKAFASFGSEHFLDLELGAVAGGKGYAVPSSVFIADDGRAYFGFEAVDISQELVESGRKRLDSIKEWLSQRSDGNLDGESCLLSKEMNPTEANLTQGDLIRIFLSYLTDCACIALQKHEERGLDAGRYIRRNFARPCWSNDGQAQWADRQMRDMLAQSQILADTFTGRWNGGISVFELKSAIEQVKRLPNYGDYLIDAGIPEPVAVAAGAIAETENFRDAFMVVDVGAGTTDFGLFVAARDPESGESKVFQVLESIQGLRQAGDKVDNLLRAFICKKEDVESHDVKGRIIFSDLARRIRGLKETLFLTKRLEYTLSDHTVGNLTLNEFLDDLNVQRFSATVQAGFLKALESIDENYLKWLSLDGIRLNVVLTGGSSTLPMMEELAKGVINVRGYKILRQRVDPQPKWMDNMPEELRNVYPQLAVAIGGASDDLPETYSAPPVFGGGGGHSHYTAGRLQISGS
jgi:hypothetical protein